MFPWRLCCGLVLVCFVVSICTGQSTNGASPSQPALTLADAISLARKQNPQIQISTLEVSKAIEQTNQVKTNRFAVFKVYANVGASLIPIDLTIPKGTLGTYPGTGPIPGEEATIRTPRRITGLIYASAAQPLSQLYKVGLAVRETRVGEEIAREKLRQQVQDTTNQVKQAYYQLTEIQSQIASAEVSRKYLQELLAYIGRNVAQETALKSDALSAKAQLSQQEYKILTLRNRLDEQKEAFNRLLGRDLETEFAVQEVPVPSSDEMTLSAAQTKAIAQRPEMRQARLQLEKAKLDVRRQRAEYLPDLSAHVSYLAFPNVNFFPQNVASAGFLLEWQPFDWGLKRHKISELQMTSKQALLSEHDAREQILLDVNARYRRLTEARALLQADTAVQAAEREKMRIVVNRYEQKSALLTDVLEQQSRLAQSDADYQQALANFWLAKADFDRSLGEP